LNEPKTRGRPAKPSRTLDDEIAEAEARLQALRGKQQEEKERRERDANRGKILALIEAEGLDAAAPEQWQAVLPKLRQLLKIEAPVQASKDPEPAPTQETTGDLAQAPA
jgi:hypothetical protein